jgi:hypothetical protein
LSEQYPPDAPPPEEIPSIPQITDTPAESQLPAIATEVPTRAAPRWIAPAWFFFGVIVGIVGFAAYNAFLVKPSGPTAQAQLESVDQSDAMQAAARNGVLEAIATLQAGGGQQPSAQEPQGPQVVANNAFTVREANRQGSANATVTIFEFSDFQ